MNFGRKNLISDVDKYQNDPLGLGLSRQDSFNQRDVWDKDDYAEHPYFGAMNTSAGTHVTGSSTMNPRGRDPMNA